MLIAKFIDLSIKIDMPSPRFSGGMMASAVHERKMLLSGILADADTLEAAIDLLETMTVRMKASQMRGALFLCLCDLKRPTITKEH